MKHFLAIASVSLFISSCAYAKTTDIEIPRTMSGDIYKYYVVGEGKDATNAQLIYKRVGASSFDFGKVEVNCASRMIRLIGTSVRSPRDIIPNPTDWIRPAISTIQSDMINYMCR